MTAVTTVSIALSATATTVGPFGVLLLLMPLLLLGAGIVLAEPSGPGIRWISIVRGPVPATIPARGSRARCSGGHRLGVLA